MGCILIAMPKIHDSNQLAEMLRRSGIWQRTYVCSSGNEVLRETAEKDVSLVICTKKMSDMGYEELSTYLPMNVPIMLLTKDAGLVPFSSNVVILLMPFKVGDLVDTVNTLIPEAYRKPRKVKKERAPEEQKVIDVAKLLLMNRNHMTEPEAFRFIQKLSMNSGRTLLESAQLVIDNNST